MEVHNWFGRGLSKRPYYTTNCCCFIFHFCPHPGAGDFPFYTIPHFSGAPCEWYTPGKLSRRLRRRPPLCCSFLGKVCENARPGVGSRVQPYFSCFFVSISTKVHSDHASAAPNARQENYRPGACVLHIRKGPATITNVRTRAFKTGSSNSPHRQYQNKKFSVILIPSLLRDRAWKLGTCKYIFG